MRLIIDIPDKVYNEYREGVMSMENNCIIGNAVFDGIPYEERPQGEYEFIEILAQYVPNDICTYPEYKGKPYYSIHYKQSGEEFVGFGTYNPEVLSRYLKEYFMKGGAK